MASFAKFVVSILAVTGFGYELHTGEILTGGVEFEKDVAEACAAEIVGGGVAAGELGALVGGLACAAEGSVTGAVTVAAAVVDVGVWAGCELWDWAASSSTTSKLVAPPGMLRAMRLQFARLKEPFAEMGADLKNMTEKINAKKWAEVAAQATLALGAAKKFSLAMKIALKEGRCDQPPVEAKCPDSYELLNDGDTKTCQNQPVDCYEACCREQDTWCNGDSECQHRRGCGHNWTPAPTFFDVNCQDLMDTLGDFQQATTDIGALHDCASKLAGEGGTSSDTDVCSQSFERRIRMQIKSNFARVKKDLDTLTELYYKMATTSPATALMDKRSNRPSILVDVQAGDCSFHIPWLQSYAKVNASCHSIERKANGWVDECDASLAESKMPVEEMLTCLFFVVFLLVVGCCVYFRFIDSARRGQWLHDVCCCIRRDNAMGKERPLLRDSGGRAPLDQEGQSIFGWTSVAPTTQITNEENLDSLPGDEKARPKVVFITFMVVYTLLIGLVTFVTFLALLTPSPHRLLLASRAADASCMNNLEHANKMADVCMNFAGPLKAGHDSAKVGIDELMEETVKHMANIDEQLMMPK